MILETCQYVSLTSLTWKIRKMYRLRYEIVCNVLITNQDSKLAFSLNITYCNLI